MTPFNGNQKITAGLKTSAMESSYIREVRASWLELITAGLRVCLINSFLFCLADKTLSSVSWINCVSLLTERTAEFWMKHWASITCSPILIIVSFLRLEGAVERFGGRFYFLCRYTWKNNETSWCVRGFSLIKQQPAAQRGSSEKRNKIWSWSYYSFHTAMG